MRRNVPPLSSAAVPAQRRSPRRRGFRPLLWRLEDRTLLSLNPTFTSVVASVGQVASGQPVTFTAYVSELPPAGATPTGGTVTFSDGSTVLGSAPLSGGVATFTTSSLGLGDQTISAVYSGDGQNFAGSSSGTVAQLTPDPNGGSLGAVDAQGDRFFIDSSNNVITEVTPNGAVTTVAGNGLRGYSGDGGAATAAELNNPLGLAVDAHGDLFIADSGNNVVREVTPNGKITTFAGNGVRGYSGDGGPATAAELNPPVKLAVDAQGDLFIADSGSYNTFVSNYNNVIRKVAPDGVISTVAGNGVFGYFGFFGTFTPISGTYTVFTPADPDPNQNFGNITGLATDAQGDLFIGVDRGVVHEVTAAGTMRTVVAGLSQPYGLAADTQGDLFIGEDGGDLEMVPDGTIKAVAVGPNDLAVVGVDAQEDLFLYDDQLVGLGASVDVASPPLITFTTSPGTLVAGYPWSMTVTVASQDPNLGTPPGSISVSLAGSNGSVWTWQGRTLDDAGTVTLPIGVLGGTYGVTVVYTSSSPYFLGYTVTFPNAITVAPLPTTTSVSLSTDAPVYGQPVTLTATTLTEPNPDQIAPQNGTVTFYDGTTAIGTAQPNYPGVAAITTSSLSLGEHTISAVYSGDGQNFLGSASATPVSLDVTAAPTDTTVTFSSAPSNPALVALQATVAGQFSSVATPTGSIQFMINGVNVGPAVTLDDTGAATVTLTPAQALELVADGASAVYTSDSSDFTGSTGTLPVDEITTSTTTAVAASVANAVFGQPETFTATVTPQVLGIGPPTGTVQFLIDGTPYNAPVEAGSGGVGIASVTLSTLPLGSHNVSAVYNSDSNEFTSSSSPTAAASTGVATFGYGPYQFSGDGGAATAALLGNPQGVAMDAHGDLFIADTAHNVVREVSPEGVITTITGQGPPGYSGTGGYSGDGGPAVDAELNAPSGLAVDAQGDLFIADTGNNVVREVTPNGTIITVAGNIAAGGSYGGDNGNADLAGLTNPTALAFDKQGDLFISDSGNSVVREVLATVTNGVGAVTPTSTITTVAGNNASGGTYGGDGGSANQAGLNDPSGLAVDAQGDLFISDSGNSVVREVLATVTNGVGAVTPTSTITTVAGNNASGGTYGGDGGSANQAGLNDPSGLAVDAQGDLFISDSGNSVVREVLATVTNGVGAVTPTSTITTVAGNNASGGTYGGDGGSANQAGLNDPSGLAVDAQGDLFISDSGNSVVREVLATVTNGVGAVTPTSTITTVAGNVMTSGLYGGAQHLGMVVDAQGDLFYSAGNAVEKISPGGLITTIAGGATAGYSGDGGFAINATLNSPSGLAMDTQGDLFIADAGNDRVREVIPGPLGLNDGTINTVAGDGTAGSSGDGGLATAAQLSISRFYVSGLAVDSQGDLFITDSGNNAIREVLATVTNGVSAVTSDSTIITVAGGVNDAAGVSLNQPQGVAVDAQGNLIIGGAGEIASVYPGPDGLLSDGGAGDAGSISYYIRAVAADPQGDLFFGVGGGVLEAPGGVNGGYFTDPEPFIYMPGVTVTAIATDAQDDLFYAARGGSIFRLGSGTITVSVSPAATTTTVTASSASPVAGQSVTFTAAVAPQAGGAIPTGAVQFEVDGTDVGTPEPLDSTGTATLTLNSLGLGAHTVSAVYTTDSADFTASTGSTSLTVVAATASNIESAVNSAESSGGSFTLLTTTNSAVSTAVQAVDAASPANPVTVTLDLDGATTSPGKTFAATGNVQVDLVSSSGTATVQGAMVTSGTVVVAASVAPVDWTVNGGNVIVEGSASAGDFIVNGGTVTLADGTVITGNSPAITVNGGTVVLQGVTAQTATNSPTIVVNAGSLVVRNSTIEESTGAAEPAILITGGSVDLGTSSDPGGNTLNVNGTGTLIENTGGNPVSAVGDTFENNGTGIASGFGIVSLTAPSPQTAFQGVPHPLNLGALTDTRTDAQSWTVDINWGDGTPHAGFSATSTGPLSTPSHAFTLPGKYTVTVTATDPMANQVAAWDLVKTFTVSVASSIFVLDPSAGGALTLSGSASLNIPGAVVVDSSATTAILASGNAKVTAASVLVEGSVSKSGNASATRTGTPARPATRSPGWSSPRLPLTSAAPSQKHSAATPRPRSTRAFTARSTSRATPG